MAAARWTRSEAFRRFDRHYLKALTFWLLALPGLWLAWQWAGLLSGGHHDLGFNPIETTHRFLGDTALRILLMSLAVTPLRDLLKWPGLIKIRRRIGLAAFWYAGLHLAAYLGLDLYIAAGQSLGGMWSGLFEDIRERIYITLGATAFLLLLPLAITSFDSMIRRLGAALWQRLHFLVYPLSVLAVFHHGYMVKGHQIMPWIHGGILALLLAYRLAKFVSARRVRAPAA